MGSDAEKLHIFLFPFMASGHMIPIIDIARLFAARGNKSTIITTPLNALLIQESINGDQKSGLDIGVQIIPFPSVEVGLPEGCENSNTVTSPEMITNFFKACDMLQQPFEKLLEEQKPDCVVGDMILTWTTDAAKKYGIPRLVFHGKCYFPLCVVENITRFAPHEKVESDSNIFVVPGLPDRIEMTKSQLPQPRENRNRITDIQAKVLETEVTSYGVLVNSFYEMEPAYADYYKKDMRRRAWNIGPVSLYNRDSKAQRGQKATIDDNYCISWLNSKETNSVLYVSFGSLYRIGTIQMHEIAMGLEASGVPFIWVVRTKNDSEHALPEGFEDRTQGKGLIIREWAPQVLILDHPAVGGFMTHCGWNSTFEGITAGVPLITWPLFAEQFHNEKLVTQVLKIGIESGNKLWKSWMEPDSVLVTKERIQEVVTQLMSNGIETEDMRRRAKELREMAMRAVEKGGSSYNDLTALIEELKVNKQKFKQ
ncbi:Udp-glycosyltransferase 73b5 [Thalictrum thalictroides]|uniref:Glycosyltransferase n=1 Tax=Thalictrum thalictroides TaxID=46969 RepID=A0A7J6WX30_THATH|nr:Udp-glycosyltransferase 73b5 [Thalictrum thalictroides]